jgi:hypothetical protein
MPPPEQRRHALRSLRRFADERSPCALREVPLPCGVNWTFLSRHFRLSAADFRGRLVPSCPFCPGIGWISPLSLIRVSAPKSAKPTGSKPARGATPRPCRPSKCDGRQSGLRVQYKCNGLDPSQSSCASGPLQIRLTESRDWLDFWREPNGTDVDSDCRPLIEVDLATWDFTLFISALTVQSMAFERSSPRQSRMRFKQIRAARLTPRGNGRIGQICPSRPDGMECAASSSRVLRAVMAMPLDPLTSSQHGEKRMTAPPTAYDCRLRFRRRRGTCGTASSLARLRPAFTRELRPLQLQVLRLAPAYSIPR